MILWRATALLLLSPFAAHAQVKAHIAYAAQTLEGTEFRVGAGEPPTLVAVFATWCRACRGEFATLDSLHKILTPRGIRVLALSVDDAGKDALVRKYVAARATHVPVVHDGSGAVSRTFGTVGVPETYLIDAQGAVQWSGRGALNGGDAALSKALARLR